MEERKLGKINKTMHRTVKGSPLLIIVLLVVTAFAVGAAMRFALIKPVGVTVNILDNQYIIEIYTAATGGTVIATIPFAGDLIRDDPSQPTCIVSTGDLYITRTGTAIPLYVSWSVSGLPGGAVMTWQDNTDIPWGPGTDNMLEFDTGTTQRIIKGYISGIDKTHEDISDIVITFEVHDQVT